MLAVVTPALLAVFPVLSLFRQNQTDVVVTVLYLPLVAATASALLVHAALLVVVRDAVKASVATSLAVLGFFYVGFFPWEASTWFLLTWLMAFVASTALVLLVPRDLSPVLLVAALAAAVMAVPQAVGVVAYQLRHQSVSAADPRLWPTSLAPPAPPADPSTLPDIYLLIPDDYARHDVLTGFFHHDDGPFMRALRQRGFVVDAQARSPYADSESNIAATVNMDYLTNFPRILGPTSQDVRPVKKVIADNRAARLLRAVGYEYVHLDTDAVTFPGDNPRISPLAPPDSFANLWLRKSLLHRLGGPVGFDDAGTNARYRSSIDSEFDRLTSLPSTDRPRFVVFHTLLPHDPYVYDDRGRAVSYHVGQDGDLSSATGKRHYLDQLDYLGTRLLRAVDSIRAHAKRPPVIVIQSDEGFEANPDVIGEAAMRQIRVKGLSAFSLPPGTPQAVPDPPNSVNVLRMVFNRVLGTAYPMLRSASYPEGDLPYDFKEMTVH